jgi:hypothetical protein
VMRLLWLGMALGFCWPGASPAQSLLAVPSLDVPISTDRPSIGTGPDLVPVHRVIVENGIGWNVDRGLATIDWPETLFRVGVTRDFEMRATLPDIEHTSGTGSYQEGDFGLSAKIRLPSSERLPMGVVLGFSAPTGSRGVTAGGWDPGALFSTSHVFSPRIGSFASAELSWAGGGSAGRQTVTQLALDGLWNTTATVTNFIEYAPLFSTGNDTSGYTVDTGVLWVVRRFIQFDVHGGRTWTGSDVATVAGLGVSFSSRRKGLIW